MTWNDSKKLMNLAGSALGALGLIESLMSPAAQAVRRIQVGVPMTPLPGAPSEAGRSLAVVSDALNIASKVIRTVRAGLEGRISVEQVEDELGELHSEVRRNDQATKAAIDAKFGGEDD